MMMTQTYFFKSGQPYYLPDYGPPARWCSEVSHDRSTTRFPVASYYECDAENLCARAINIYTNGRVILAFPGGSHGHELPDQEIPLAAPEDARLYFREMPQCEFEALWVALAPTYEQQLADTAQD